MRFCLSKAFSANNKRYVAVISSVVLVFLCTVLAIQPFAFAATTQNSSASAQISFTFDDGLQSNYRYAAPTLNRYGLKGTSYVITNCVGMTTTPNNCLADKDKTYMTWSQLSSLRNTYGWEIGSHTVSHPYLASSDAEDGQPNVLTVDQVRNELASSKSALNTHGFSAESFSTPYGDYNPVTLSEIAKVYANHRGFADMGLNHWPHNEYLIRDFQVQNGVKIDQIKSQIDQAISSRSWLVLTFHDIVSGTSYSRIGFRSSGNHTSEYDCSVTLLDQIAAYVKSKKSAGLITDRTISQAKATGANLLSNGTFDAGLGGGWFTDSANSVTADNTGNGSYPNATSSIHFTTPAVGKESHLYSPTIAVSATTAYLLRSFLSVRNVLNGSVGYYIDEYSSNGSWISGQYKKAETNIFTENLNMVYVPSSLSVNNIRVQIIGSGSTLDAYVDNVELIALTNSTTTPRTNLITNGDFEQDFNGWHTDNSSIINVDGANHGSTNSPLKSAHLAAGTANAHLFSSKVSVKYGTSYSIAAWLNLISVNSGSVGFYIDEYDSAGNWISGQYKADASAVGIQDVSTVYLPSSAGVASASLQVIVIGGSGANGYLDDVRWYKN